MAKILEEAGVDALHVDVGCYEAWYKAINTVYQPPMVQLPVAEEIKKHVTVPVLSQGKMQNPADAEAALQDGKADMIGLGIWPSLTLTGSRRSRDMKLTTLLPVSVVMSVSLLVSVERFCIVQ